MINSILKRFRILYPVLKMVWVSSPKWTIAQGVLLFFQATLPLFYLYLTKNIIDRLTQAQSQVLSQAYFSQILTALLLIGLVSFLIELVNSISGFVGEVQSQEVTDYVQNLIHTKSLELDLDYYENPQYYDQLHQAQGEAPYRPTIILNRALALGQSSFSLGAIALLLLSLHWGITLTLFVLVLPLLLVRMKAAKQFFQQWKNWTIQERRSNYFHGILTHLSYAKEIRIFNLGSYFKAQFEHLRKDIRQQKATLAQRKTRAEILAQGSATIILTTALIFITYQTFIGKLSLGSLVMYYQAFQRGQSLLKEGARNLASLYENSLFLQHFYQFLDLPKTVREATYPRRIPESRGIRIEFDQVAFSYPHSERKVLEEISFTIAPGETIALVGENGAGKTTLIKLLCRLYEPNKGKITLNGIDLREIETHTLRNKISVIFQDYAHYNLTVQENIGLGNLEALEKPEAIQKAAEWAGIKGAIEKLPKQYKTLLGTEFEEGEELSIGEWQKIALARCFLRSSPLIILDEPTSALDPESEAKVLEQFHQLTQNRTALLISHRLSTVKLADRIFVLNRGKIAEQGTHQELMAFNGIYAHLFKLQGNSYQY